jgi:hypothetical protein
MAQARAVGTLAGIVKREANVLAHIDGFWLCFWLATAALAVVALITRAPPGPFTPAPFGFAKTMLRKCGALRERHRQEASHHLRERQGRCLGAEGHELCARKLLLHHSRLDLAELKVICDRRKFANRHHASDVLLQVPCRRPPERIQPAPVSGAILPPRECQCLAWAARG